MNMQVAHVSGHCEGIFATAKSLLFSWPSMSPTKLSLIIMSNGIDSIVKA
jgi:hypothetical protein